MQRGSQRRLLRQPLCPKLKNGKTLVGEAKIPMMSAALNLKKEQLKYRKDKIFILNSNTLFFLTLKTIRGTDEIHKI